MKLRNLVILSLVFVFNGCYYTDKYIHKSNYIDREFDEYYKVKKSDYNTSYSIENTRLRVKLTDRENYEIYTFIERKNSYLFKEILHKRASNNPNIFFKSFEDYEYLHIYKKRDIYIVSFYIKYVKFDSYVSKENVFEYKLLEKFLLRYKNRT